MGIDRRDILKGKGDEKGKIEEGIGGWVEEEFGKKIGGLIIKVDFYKRGVNGFNICISCLRIIR